MAKPNDKKNSFSVELSGSFILLSLVVSALVAFAVGSGARFVLLEQYGPSLLGGSPQLGVTPRNISNVDHVLKEKIALPPPLLRDGKEFPKTMYSSKNFDIAASSTSRNVLVERKQTDGQKKDWEVCEDGEDSENCRVSPETLAYWKQEGEDEDEDTGTSEEGEEEEHLPAGQHLLVDIREVNSNFLNSELLLAQAMVDVVAEADLTLLSYHCHSLVPTGVSCVGVLLESHISFHTWPTEGVITLDLFTCGSGALIPVLPSLERIFAVPEVPRYEGEDVPEPTVVWSHTLRGFRSEGDRTKAYELGDLGQEVLRVLDLDMKEEVVSIVTDYQRIDVYDIIDPRNRDINSYYKSFNDDDSYEAENAELFRPNRKVFLDGILQSTSYGDEAYHEALVHPAMFAHNNPERVAIIGGGEGATLREVLKHKSLEHVKMIEIDDIMVAVSHEHLPAWNDCSDIVGSTRSCFEDLRADIRMEDALAFFLDNFVDDGESDEEIDPFDVIIMDALDPQDNVAFADQLYNNDKFLTSMYNGLNDDGVLVLQLGLSPYLGSPADEYSKNKNRALITVAIEKVGFKSVHVYEEGHCGFGDPWSYLVACKDASCRRNWYASEAQVDVAIHKRMLRTYSGKPQLKYFDGPTMKSYQVPNRAFETVFCRKENPPMECSYLQGYKPTVPNAPSTSFSVGVSKTSASGYGVFAKERITKGSMLMQEKGIHPIKFSPTSRSLLNKLHDHEPAFAKKSGAVQSYMIGYGFENVLFGDHGYDADSSIATFISHGCGGSYNINADPSVTSTENTVDPVNPPDFQYAKGSFKTLFNPVIDRHLPHLVGGLDVALRDIEAGEEIFDNFLTYVSSKEKWNEVVKDLKAECASKLEEKEI